MRGADLISIIEIDLMAEQSASLALDCTGLPNKVDTEDMCVCNAQYLGRYAPMGIAARSNGPKRRPISWKEAQ